MTLSETKSKGNILVVDDQVNWRLAITHLLEDTYQVQTVSSFVAAENIIDNSTFDVVVLDIRLVDEDVFNVGGLALLRKLKTEKPETKVAILTGYPDSIRNEMLESFAVDALLYKAPEGRKFDVAGFRQKISELINRNRK